MADKKISELVELTSLATDDVFPVVDAGASATKRVTFDTLATEVRTESEPLTATTITASGDITSNGETVYHRGNIVGTVSQSGSTPTGAVIEKGVNSNGQYAKFADGTMIVIRSGVEQPFSNQSSRVSSFAFAASFSGTSYSVVGSSRNANMVVVRAGSGSRSSSFASYGNETNNSSNFTGTVSNDFIIYGRWY